MHPTIATTSRRLSRLSDETAGMLLGLAGVAIFSLTLPFTRMAVAGFDPAFVALGRALAAAMLAAIWLTWNKAPWPPRSAWRPLAWVALGGVARVGQVQLLQPFLSMAGAALLLSETIGLSNILFALAVISVVATGRRTRIQA